MIPIALALVAFAAVWLSSSAMRRKGTITAAAQRALLILMGLLAAATIGFEWWNSAHLGT
ncbi:MAG TPA: hypothetical protein VK617_05630 [Gemmatimonadaceae bacterium]|nr:hypothetical protein [Gemmatimonadaceae bacterium]